MDIERLKELKDYLRVANELSILNDDNLMQRIVDNNDVTDTIDIAIELLNAEIARQSVTDEQIRTALDYVSDYKKEAMAYDTSVGISPPTSEEVRAWETVETALQAYQPWVSVEDEKPESGKHVLLCCEIRPSGKRYVCDGYYAKPKSIIGGDDGECSTEYDEETDEYYLLEGYYEVIKNWGDYSSIAIDDFVVAWKSLPEPPKGE